MKKTFLTLAIGLVLTVGAAGMAPAVEKPNSPASAVYIESISTSSIVINPLLAQYPSDNSYSSSGSTRIPRGAIKLGIFLAIGLISLCGWALKRVFA